MVPPCDVCDDGPPMSPVIEEHGSYWHCPACGRDRSEDDLAATVPEP